MTITERKYIYMIGVGGIGMSALARFFKSRGACVAGYDSTETDLTRKLISEGIDIHYKDDVELIDPAFLNPDQTLVVYTPAIPNAHVELNYFRDNRFLFLKRAKVLGLLSKDKHCVAVAGTHGKTSVSTMIAFLMKETGVHCNAFLGGISTNFESNYLLNAESEKMVVEADEYDRSFLNLYPDVLVVTAIDPDHLEIYGDRDHIVTAFNELVSQMNQDGTLILNQAIAGDVRGTVKHRYTYSFDNPESDFYASGVSIQDGCSVFTFHALNQVYPNMVMHLPGRINIENAVAALAVAWLEGALHEALRLAIHEFRGVKRRFDYHINTPELVYIDDYAHHPAEMEALLLSLRDFYPDRKILAIFQPHLYTRTRDFAALFARVLDDFDETWVMDIYPARELPIPGVNADLILQHMQGNNKKKVTPVQLPGFLMDRCNDVVLTIGAGNIDQQVPVVKSALQAMEMKK